MRFGQYLVMELDDDVHGFELIDMERPEDKRSEEAIRIFNDDPSIKDKIQALEYMIKTLRK